jgi:DNA-binding transcriptional LysR family regulator
MEINQLKSFYEIVKTGSFSKAARNLFITPSAVTHQIRNLEKDLNIRLFERAGKTVKLTRGGKLLSDVVRTFLYDLDRLKKLSNEIRECKTGRLHIAATHGIMFYVLPDVVSKFKRAFPEVKFNLTSRSLLFELLPMLANEDIDLLVGPRSDIKLPDKVLFLFWKSFSTTLVTDMGHLLRKKKTIELADISAHSLILFRKGGMVRKAVEDAFIQANLPYEVAIESDGAENAKEYVKRRIGITILPSFTLSPEDRSRLWSCDVSHLFGKTDYGIYYSKNKYIDSAFKHFIKSLAPELSQHFLLDN